jgi:NAD(P)-dependent dehydrogenase (short-subunit alcohol dehydrogenase family)
MSSQPEPLVALVTGGSRGIGRAIAHTLAGDGYHVIITARSQQAVDDAAEFCRADGLLATGIVCDVGDRLALEALMDEVAARFGRLDVLVNNAGLLPPAKRAEHVELADWDAALAVNLTAPWILATRAKALMPEGGVVVNIASTASFYPSTGLVAYDVSKAGLVMLTRVLALEWARSNIRVVGVAPGKIDTDLLAPIKSLAADGKIALNPQRRIGHPRDVANLVSFLVSDTAAFITGVVVPVDGGELLVATSDMAK